MVGDSGDNECNVNDGVSSIDAQDRLGVLTGVVRLAVARTCKGSRWAVPDHVLEKLETLSMQPSLGEPVYTVNGKRDCMSFGDDEVECSERSGKRVRSVDDMFGDMLAEWRTASYEELRDACMETSRSASDDALFATCLSG